MGVRAQLETTGELKLSGNINSRLPSITNGLVAHYPFDNTPSPSFLDFSKLKVLGVANYTTNPLYNWFNTNCVLTRTETLETDSIATIVATYDLVVVDYYAWGISTGIMSRIKELVDAGISVVATGNDTTTNVFVTAYTAVAHAVYSIETIYGKTYNIGGADVYGGIDSLAPHTTSLYKRTDTNQTMGYIYQSPTSGAILYFDQDGTISPSHEMIQDGIASAIESTKSRRSRANLTEEGVCVEQSTVNQWGAETYTWSTGSGITVRNVLNIPRPSHLSETLEIVSLEATTGEYRAILWTTLNTILGPGVKYTHSVWAYLVSGTYVGIGQHWNPWDTSDAHHYSIPKGVWTKLEVTITTADNIQLEVALEYGTDGIAYFIAPQYEQKDFSTEFVYGSRASSPGFYIPNPVTEGEFTVSFKCKINTNIGTPIAYQTVFSMGDYYTNNSFTIMDINGTTVSGGQRLIRKGNLAEWGWAGGLFSTDVNFKGFNVFTVVRNATNYRCYSNGVYVGTITHNSTIMQALIWIGSRNNGSQVGSSNIKDLSIYNRALSDAEVLELGKHAFNLQPVGHLYNKINTQDRVGWIKVYDGLCTQLMSETVHDGELLAYPDITLQFNQVMVRAKHWDAEEIQELTETCRLEKSMKYYARWLDLLADAGAPQVKFHGLDGIQDVGFITASKILFGYGNSWRRIAPLLPYVDGTTSTYLGAIPASIVNEDWEAVHGGTPLYAYYMHLNYPNETGIYKLTPRQCQMIEIYVRMKPVRESKMEVIEDTVNIVSLSTQEVL